jgi:hypothetical protein
MSSTKQQSAVAKVIAFASINYCGYEKQQHAKHYCSVAVEGHQHGSLKHFAHSGSKNSEPKDACQGHLLSLTVTLIQQNRDSNFSHLVHWYVIILQLRSP